MENNAPSDSQEKKREMISEHLHKAILRHRMAKIDKWKPGIILSMREEAENRCQKEYNEEIEKLGDELYELRHLSNSQSKEIVKYKAKAEEYKELYEKLLEKHEAKSEKLGETKEKLNATVDDLKEALNENTPLEENSDFNKELKTLITRCNNEKFNKAEIMSSFSAKWNVSLKEIVDEEDEDKVIDFKWKEI